MAIIRLATGKWHSIQEENGRMFAMDMCDCGRCPIHRYDINEGDTVISEIAIHISGRLKNIHIISDRIRTHRNITTVLENVRFDDYISYSLTKTVSVI